MNCNYCRAPLPAGARVCPNCGAATSVTPPSTFYTKGGTASLDATIPASASPYPAPAPPQAPSTGYGPINPYGQQNAYPPPAAPNSLDPYGPLAPPTPTPPAYNMPPAGAQPYTPIPPAFMPPGQPAQKPARRFSAGLVVLLVVLLILLIAGSGGIYYVAVYQPGVQHAQATATAQVNATQVAHVTQTANAQATAAVENPYTHSGTLVFSDPMSTNNGGHNWDENSNCTFTGGTYHAIAPNAQYSDYCIATNTDFTNFAYEVQMKVLKGDGGGIIFHIENRNPNQYYEFYMYEDGYYGLRIMNGGASILKQGSTRAFNTGLNQTNLLGVVVNGNAITLYVNHQSLVSVTNSAYTHGAIGVEAAVYNQTTEVSYSNARLWKL